MSDEPIEISEGADVFSMWETLGPVPQKISICALLLYFIPILTAISIRMDPSSEQFLMFIVWPFLMLILLLIVWLILSTVVTLFDTSGSRRALSVILLVPTIIGMVFVVIAVAFQSVLVKVTKKHSESGGVNENGE